MAAGQAAARSAEAQSVTERTAAPPSEGDDARWRPVLGLPCLLTVDLPMPGFRVTDFLKLQAGSVIATRWRLRRDVPLRVNGTLIAWGEFERSGRNLGVRITELA